VLIIYPGGAMVITPESVVRARGLKQKVVGRRELDVAAHIGETTLYQPTNLQAIPFQFALFKTLPGLVIHFLPHPFDCQIVQFTHITTHITIKLVNPSSTSSSLPCCLILSSVPDMNFIKSNAQKLKTRGATIDSHSQVRSIPY
jgi:hypothetical protein